jgi:hypothetical protein
MRFAGISSTLSRWFAANPMGVRNGECPLGPQKNRKFLCPSAQGQAGVMVVNRACGRPSGNRDHSPIHISPFTRDIPIDVRCGPAEYLRVSPQPQMAPSWSNQFAIDQRLTNRELSHYYGRLGSRKGHLKAPDAAPGGLPGHFLIPSRPVCSRSSRAEDREGCARGVRCLVPPAQPKGLPPPDQWLEASGSPNCEPNVQRETGAIGHLPLYRRADSKLSLVPTPDSRRASHAAIRGPAVPAPHGGAFSDAAGLGSAAVPTT